MTNDEFAIIEAIKPKCVTCWARKDVTDFWLGRTVSVKNSYKQVQSPSLIGTIVEVGPAGWVTVLWETGEINAKFHRCELDDYQGPPNPIHKNLLLHNPAEYKELLESLRTLDRSTIHRNGGLV